MLRRSGESLSKFLQIFAVTKKYVGQLNRAERQHGHLPREVLHPVMSEWARQMLDVLNVQVESCGDAALDTPALLVGNHVSYLDIPILMSLLPVVFVAKKQISRWPVFGRACNTVGTVWVERKSGTSRRDAGEAIGPYIRREQRSIAVFPSGTTTTDESKPWRWGAFSIAKRHRIPIRPFRFRYTPVRRAAFIDKDLFPFHLWNLIHSGGVKASVEFHPTVMVEQPEHDCAHWWSWSREGLE